MPTGACLKIQYTGVQASCLLVADSVAKTLTSRIGAFGAEAPDATFGVAGVMDLTAAAYDTLEELRVLIDAYANYSCSIKYGDDIDTENVLTATVQAKGVPAYILFDIVSILDTYALTNFSRVQALMGTDRVKNSDQTLIEILINGVTEQAEIISRRKLKARTYGVGQQKPYDFDGNGLDRIALPAYPINSITHLYIDEDRAFGATTEVPVADYLFFEEEGMIVYPDDVFDEGIRNVRIEYNAGFTTIPNILQQAVVEAVDWNFTRMRSASIGKKGQSADGINTSLEIEIPLSARRVFEYYGDRML
jgi:hypothetical protein